MAAPAEHFKTAEQVLAELGVDSPQDLAQIEAIAQYLGATVRYCPLDGCAARITGRGNRAIITVDQNSPRPRQRFSIGHELGHWMHDRGTVSLSCEANLLATEWSKGNPEARANRFASDLLLPLSLFRPLARQHQAITFDTVRALAKSFDMSLTATAIRLVEHGPLQSMLVCYSDRQREWFVRGPNVPRMLWPAREPGRDTYAADLLQGASERDLAGDVPAAAWFDHRMARSHLVYEHALRVGDTLVLSLLWWKNEEMLIAVDEHEERKAARRSDYSWR